MLLNFTAVLFCIFTYIYIILSFKTVRALRPRRLDTTISDSSHINRIYYLSKFPSLILLYIILGSPWVLTPLGCGYNVLKVEMNMVTIINDIYYSVNYDYIQLNKIFAEAKYWPFKPKVHVLYPPRGQNLGKRSNTLLIPCCRVLAR